MIQLYTGDGKGKTTAAFGLALRAFSAGLSSQIIQFGKVAPSGEGVIGQKLGLFSVHNFWSEGFLVPDADPAPFRKACLEGISFVRDLINTAPPDLLILDEAAVCLYLGVIERTELEEIIDACPASTELVITGQKAPDWLIERADLVTEMRKIKHYYDANIPARGGIEF
jgi:cob(I)alamin adenosyltransferase